MQQKYFTHTSILSQNIGRTKIQGLKFNTICQFCCFIKESCRWHWLGFFLWGSRLLPGTVPSAPWDRQVALGIITKTVLASQAPCRDPGIFRAQRHHQEPPTLEGSQGRKCLRVLGCTFCPPLRSKDGGKSSAHNGCHLGMAKICKTCLWIRKFWFRATFTCHEILVLIFFF